MAKRNFARREIKHEMERNCRIPFQASDNCNVAVRCVALRAHNDRLCRRCFGVRQTDRHRYTQSAVLGAAIFVNFFFAYTISVRKDLDANVLICAFCCCRRRRSLIHPFIHSFSIQSFARRRQSADFTMVTYDVRKKWIRICTVTNHSVLVSVNGCVEYDWYRKRFSDGDRAMHAHARHSTTPKTSAHTSNANRTHSVLSIFIPVARRTIIARPCISIVSNGPAAMNCFFRFVN